MWAAPPLSKSSSSSLSALLDQLDDDLATFAVHLPRGLKEGDHFIVDGAGSGEVEVEVPAGASAGSNLLIGKAKPSSGMKSKAAAYPIEESDLKSHDVRIANIGIIVPEHHPGDRDLYVGTPFGSVYAVQLPKGVQPGQKITVQVTVHLEDEAPAPAPAAAPAPAKLKKAASSNLSAVLDRLDDELAVLDEEIARFFVGGLEEVSIGEDTIVSGERHIVVGKLVRHRTEKWARMNREKSAWHEKRATAGDTAGLKEHPGRMRRPRTLLGNAKGALRSLTRGRKRYSAATNDLGKVVV